LPTSEKFEIWLRRKFQSSKKSAETYVHVVWLFRYILV